MYASFNDRVPEPLSEKRVLRAPYVSQSSKQPAMLSVTRSTPFHRSASIQETGIFIAYVPGPGRERSPSVDRIPNSLKKNIEVVPPSLETRGGTEMNVRRLPNRGTEK